jgi:hypothetical protein
VHPNSIGTEAPVLTILSDLALSTVVSLTIKGSVFWSLGSCSSKSLNMKGEGFWESLTLNFADKSNRTVGNLGTPMLGTEPLICEVCTNFGQLVSELNCKRLHWCLVSWKISWSEGKKNTFDVRIITR